MQWLTAEAFGRAAVSRDSASADSAAVPHSALGYRPPAPEAISPTPLSELIMSQLSHNKWYNHGGQVTRIVELGRGNISLTAGHQMPCVFMRKTLALTTAETSSGSG